MITFRTQFSLALLAGMGWMACTMNQKDLAGTWQAVAFYKNQKSAEVPLDSVMLRFTSDGAYEFRSQGFYRESGDYRLSAAYVFLSDTTENPPLQHTLKVLYLSADSLKIQMAAGDEKQVLFFVRKKD